MNYLLLILGSILLWLAIGCVLAVLIAIGPLGWAIIFMIMMASESGPNLPLAKEESDNIPDTFPVEWIKTNR